MLFWEWEGAGRASAYFNTIVIDCVYNLFLLQNGDYDEQRKAGEKEKKIECKGNIFA